MMRHILWILLCVLIAAPVGAQDINFSDLKRPGRPLTKSYTIQGVRSEGSKYIGNFNEVDGGRVATAAESSRQYQAERTKGNGNRYYECSFSCRGDGFVMYDSTEKMKIIVKADESYQAQSRAEDEAKKICSKAHVQGGLYKGTTMRSGSISCEEKQR